MVGTKQIGLVLVFIGTMLLLVSAAQLGSPQTCQVNAGKFCRYAWTDCSGDTGDCFRCNSTARHDDCVAGSGTCVLAQSPAGCGWYEYSDCCDGRCCNWWLSANVCDRTKCVY